MKTIVLLALLLLVVAPMASAQESPLRPGDRVRVTAAGVVGRYEVRRVGDARLTLVDSTGAALDVPLATVSALAVSRGPRSAWEGAGHGARIGVLAGAGGGILLGLMEGDDPPGILSFSAGEKAVAYALVFGGGAGIVGALIGASAPGEHWEGVRLDELSARTGPRLGLARDGGVAIGYTARF